MKLKGRVILVMSLLLLGGFAIYDYFQDKKNEDKKIEDSRLMSLNFEQIDRVEIERKSDKISLKRTVDGWEVLAPFKDSADNQVVDDLVKNLVPERILEVAREGDQIDWSLYGLDKPLGKILVQTTAGTQNEFVISEKKNFEENVFLRRNNENRVLVVNSNWQMRINKPAAEFRDRRFLRHKIASVDVLTLKNNQGLVEIHRVEGKWQPLSKKDLKLDQNKVRELLTSIAEAQASEVFENKQQSLPALKSLFSLRLVMDKKEWKSDVGQAQDLGIYAKVSEPEFRMKMAPGALDKLIKLTYEDLKESESAKEEPKKEKK